MLRRVTINILIMSIPFHFLKNRSKALWNSLTRIWNINSICCDKGFIWNPDSESLPKTRLRFTVQSFNIRISALQAHAHADIPTALRANSTATSQALCSVTWSTMPSFRASWEETWRPAIWMVKEKLSDVGVLDVIIFLLYTLWQWVMKIPS